jgi:hypothetical protein
MSNTVPLRPTNAFCLNIGFLIHYSMFNVECSMFLMYFGAGITPHTPHPAGKNLCPSAFRASKPWLTKKFRRQEQRCFVSIKKAKEEFSSSFAFLIFHMVR